MKYQYSIKVIAFVIVGCFWSAYALAQQPSGYFITEQEGIPSREIYAIVEDAQGFIWIGCEAGLYKYNGVDFEYFAPPNLHSKEISGLNIDRQGNLYCINFGGQVMRKVQNKMEVLPTFSTRIKQGFPRIFLDHEKNIWGIQAFELARYNPSKNQWIHQRKYKEGTKMPFLNSMLAYGGNTFLHSEQGIFILKDGKQINCPIQKLAIDDEPHWGNFFLAHVADRIALIHRLGKYIYVLEGKQFVPLKSPSLYKALRKRKVNAVRQVGKSQFWFLTYNGIVSYNFEEGLSQEFYPDIAFSDMIEDRHGQLWLTTLKNGLLVIPNRKIWWFPKEFFQVKESHINHLAYLPRKRQLYMSFLNGVIGVLDVENFNYQTFPTGLQGDISLFEVHQDKLYFNVRDSIYVGELHAFKSFAHNNAPVKTLLPQPSKDRLLLGTSWGLYLMQKPPERKIFSFEYLNKLHNAWVKDIAYFPDKNLYWIATNKGCLLLEEQQNNLKNTQHLYSKKYFRKVGFLSQDFPQVGITANGEVYDLMRQALIYQPAQQDGLLVYSVVIHQEKVFLASNQGILIFDAKNPLHHSKITALEGLGGGEIYQLSPTQDALWAATSHGLLKIPRAALNSQKKVSPSVFIKQIWIDGRETPKKEIFYLNYNQSVKIGIEAAALASGKEYRLLYRLSPKSKWEKLPPQNAQILLNPLPKGTFTLEISAEDHLQRQAKEQIKVKFVVAPPFWEKWWFYVLLFVLGSLAGLLWFTVSLKRLQQRQAAQAERIALQHELRLSRLTALKAQIKPHFIFNVLHTIQSFIYQNEKQVATDYLGKFSRFMRLVLNYAEKEWISLEEELQFIKSYVALEALQLEDNFEYQIQTEPNLKTSELLIPSFLLQPIVENVFKHAFKYKKDTKKLTVLARLLTEECYQIIIEDNGIGREQAQQLAAKLATTHTSFATQAIQSRITLYNTQYPEHILLSIEDLKNLHGTPNGTRVVIDIKNIPPS